MKKYILLAAAALVAASCGQKAGQTLLSGKFGENAPAQVHVQTAAVDTVLNVSKGAFSFSVPTDLLSNGAVETEVGQLSFVPDGSKLTFDFTGETPKVTSSDKASVTSRLNAFLDKARELAAAVRAEQDEEKGEALYQEYMKEKNDLMEEDDIIASLTDRIQKHQENANNEYQRHRKASNPITVHGINDVAVHFSKCCNPVPGDEIIGYVTRGRGVSIHRTDCQNIIQLSEDERRRLLDTEWEVGSDTTKGMKFVTSVQVVAEDRKGILMDITSVISNADIMLTQMNARRKKDSNEAIFNMSFEITSKEQLQLVATKIQQVPGVYEVIRSTN